MTKGMSPLRLEGLLPDTLHGLKSAGLCWSSAFRPSYSSFRQAGLRPDALKGALQPLKSANQAAADTPFSKQYEPSDQNLYDLCELCG